MIAVLLPGDNGVSYHRLFAPYLDLKRQGYPIVFFNDFKEISAATKNGYIFAYLIVSRAYLTKDYQAFHAQHKAAGIKIIVDMDDWWELYPTHPMKTKYDRDTRPFIIKSLQHCDIVTTTNKKLAKKISKLTKADVVIVPNAIDYNWQQWKIEKKEMDTLTFGYLGGSSHVHDIKEIGYNFKDNGKELACIKIADFCETLGATSELPTYPPKEYGKLYAKFHISLAPLLKNEFNKCKSNLKVLEAGATRTAIIASNMHPYADMIKHGWNGWLASNPREWREIIEGVSLDKAIEVGNNLHEYLRGFDMQAVNEIRKKIFT